MEHPRRRRFLYPLTMIVSLALVAAACSSSKKSDTTASTAPGASTTAGTTLAGTTLNGSGSTFQQPFDQAVIQAFVQANPSVKINYAGGGSGKGKQDLSDQVVDFAGTDSLVKDDAAAAMKGGKFLYFPTVAAPITVSYNLSGVDKLQLSADTIANIFERKITKWDDPAIKADNPDATLPGTAITVAHRAEASGTTSNFTNYLVSAAPTAWTLGGGDTVNWPADTQAGNGNGGVAQIISSTAGAIGYVDFSDAKGANLTFASIKNQAGSYVEPSLDGVSAALAQTTVNDDLTYKPLNAAGADTYPIATPTWILVYQNQTDKAKGEAIKAFLTFIYGEGQTIAPTANYAPLPDSLKSKALSQVATITVAG